MTIAELSYMYDIMRGIGGLVALIMSVYFAYTCYMWAKYFAEEKTLKNKHKALKHTIIFIFIIVILILIPSPRTMVIYEVEKHFKNQDASQIITNIINEKNHK